MQLWLKRTEHGGDASEPTYVVQTCALPSGAVRAHRERCARAVAPQSRRRPRTGACRRLAGDTGRTGDAFRARPRADARIALLRRGGRGGAAAPQPRRVHEPDRDRDATARSREQGQRARLAGDRPGHPARPGGVPSAWGRKRGQETLSSARTRCLPTIPQHPRRGLLLHNFGFVLCLRAEYAEALALADRAQALASASERSGPSTRRLHRAGRGSPVAGAARRRPQADRRRTACAGVDRRRTGPQLCSGHAARAARHSSAPSRSDQAGARAIGSRHTPARRSWDSRWERWWRSGSTR